MFSLPRKKDIHLQDIREKLDRLDDVMMELLAKRYKLIQQAGRFKTLHQPDEPLMRISREAVIIRRLVKEHPDVGWSRMMIARLWWFLMASARALEGEDLHIALIHSHDSHNHSRGDHWRHDMEQGLSLASLSTQRYGVGKCQQTTLSQALDGLLEKRYTVALLPCPRGQNGWGAFLDEFLSLMDKKNSINPEIFPHIIEKISADLCPGASRKQTPEEQTSEEHTPEESFLVLGCSKPRESGQDQTLLAITKTGVSAFLQDIQKREVKTRILGETPQWSIVECDAFLLPNDALMQKNRAYWLGVSPLLPRLL